MENIERDFCTLYYDRDNPPIIGQNKRHLPKKMEWTILTREGVENILSNESLKGVDWKVLLKLIGAVEFGNVITPNQTEIAKELGIGQASLSRALKKLVAAMAIIPIEKQGVQTQYRLNPLLGFKIASVDYRKLVHDWDRDVERYIASDACSKPVDKSLHC